MKNKLSVRCLTSFGLAILVALGAQQMLAARDAGPDMNAAARVSRLAQNVERAESVRAVKRLQETYEQYSQFGLWSDMAALFSEDAKLSYGDDNEQGRAAIQKFFLTNFGEGTNGLKPGGLHTQFALRPLVNVSADGQSAKGRWWQLTMSGQYGEKAEWAGGIFENEYVREHGVWKISFLHYYPVFAGPYETGWRNAQKDLKLIPYHYTPDETGVPIPDLPASAALPIDSKMNPATALARLETRISALNGEDGVRNLQDAYGFYVDRKMWDDVTDLFTTDGVLELGGVGIYDGPANIRRALERDGPAGLQHGQLNQHLQLDAEIAVEPSGEEARSRGIEFGLLGDADKGTQFFTLGIFENRYVKQNDIWRIREMRIFPLMKTDYAKGWAKSQVVDSAPDKEHAPNRPVPASDVMTPGAIPEFFIPNLATGKPVSVPKEAKIVGRERLLPAPTAHHEVIASGDLSARITEDERRLAVSKAWDGAENMTSAYGHYLDDLNYGPLGQLFAKEGQKEVPFIGWYEGRDRIIARDATSPVPGSRPRTSIPIHWLIQPVVLVASDGRSASIRTHLFQTGTSANRGSGFSEGVYHNQVVLEDGVWKLWSVNVDSFYLSYPYEGGWASVKDPDPSTLRQPAGPANDNYPPDIPLAKLGDRARGIRGGTGDMIVWPSILPMWFHYKNPVSGRIPPNYNPDCVTCALYPNTSMKNHGYLLPPS